MISPQQITFMEANRPHYDTLVKAQFLTNVDYPTKEGMLNVARIFAPAYQANLWCSPCVCDLFKFAYVQYDKWREQNVQHATFPKQDEPASVTVDHLNYGTTEPGVNKQKRKYTKRS